MMRYFGLLLLLFIFLLFAAPRCALAQETGTTVSVSPPTSGYERQGPFQVSLNYDLAMARTVPACCFSMNGLDGSVGMDFTHHIGVLADAGYLTTSSASIGDHLILRTYLGGARFRFTSGRFTPSLQAMIGGADASSNFSLSRGASWATSVGGGMEMRIAPQFDWRVVRAEYLLTHLPNGTDHFQNILRISTGLVFHFGGPR